MATKRRVVSRKSPVQHRSRKTVEVILNATARVLLRDGYEACTTNHVARAAGVSIGSVYQYFPNKESLILAVLERHVQRQQEAFAERLVALAGADLETTVHTLVRAMFEVQLLQPKLHRVLLEQVPRIGALKRLHELHGQYEPLVSAWLEGHADQLDLPNPSVAAYVLIAAVEGVVTRALLERPRWLELGLLEKQVSRLVLAYLRPEREPALRAAR